MYIPKINELNDLETIVAFMQRFNFATLVTLQHHIPIATHLPFLVSLEDNKVMLHSHFAKANKQWQHLEEQTGLVIFSEPHAYISPRHYEKEQNVPTWNYLAVHAYGRGRLITEEKEVFDLLEKSIQQFESDYQKQWDGLSPEYKTGMAQGIVAFELMVTDLQAKAKLSQNKQTIERQRIVATLESSPDTNAQTIAQYMKLGL